MGFIDTAPGTRLPVFYNVVHAVGKNCPNIRDDVKLVQYLLKILYEKMSASKPNGEMKVDGFCGPVTMNWILQFQLDVSRDNPGIIAVDNRVDRIRNKNFVGSISKTQYTLGILNHNSKKLNPEGWAATYFLVPLQNPESVPPPSPDVIREESVSVEEQGGF
jgi:hypothetical protein